MRQGNGIRGRGRALMAGLLLTTAMAGVAVSSAGIVFAQSAEISFSIPAGPLGGALAAFGRQSGLQVTYNSALADNRRSAGVSGTLAPSDALARILDGSGLSYTFANASTVSIFEMQAGQAAGDVAGGTLLEPIVVQGEKMPRDLFSTYSSVGVVTGQELEDYNVRDLNQALNRMGNVRALPTGAGNGNFVIRGLNSDGVTQPSRSSPVISVVVDGAMQGVEATRRGSRNTWDVEQVEVLRGPQSTLQGRNSLGGTVLVKTKDPTWTPEFIIDGSVGTEDLLSGAFAFSGPLIEDQLAVRLSGSASRESKGIDYADPSIASLGEDEFQEIRGKILLTPEAIPEFTGLFTISRTHDKPGWGLVSGPDFFDRYYEDSTNSAAEFRDTYVNRYVADLSYELTPDLTIKSVTALTDTSVAINAPLTMSFPREETREGRDLSQDVRLVYDPSDSPLSGVFGVFAGRFSSDIDSHIQTRLLEPYGLPLVDYQQLIAKNKTTSVAAYADLRYRFADDWTLMAGGRLLRDKVSSDYRGSVLDPAGTLGSGFPVYASLDENTATSNTVFLPKVGIAYDFTENQGVALTAAKGYRAGFSEAVAGTTEINEVDPEFLWSYELAYRSKWFDDRLQVNANVFYYDYDNQQILTFNPAFPGQTVTENSAKSHAYGAEIELRYLATSNFEVYSSVGLLRTRFDEGTTSDGLNLNGKEFPESPTLTASLGGIWRHDSGFFAGADISYTDGYYSGGDLANTPDRFVDSFTVVNAQVGYEAKNFTVTAFARNLFDEEYLTSITSGGTQATIGDGRVFGIRATGRF